MKLGPGIHFINNPRCRFCPWVWSSHSTIGQSNIQWWEICLRSLLMWKQAIHT